MTGMNLSLAQVLDWLPDAELLGDASVRLDRVGTDTRSVQPGDLFVALRGERFDGADFLPAAARAGAAAAICHNDARQALQRSGLPGLLVADTRAALGQLAARWRQRFHGPLIAVTGSNGKTTVTQMIAAILHAWQGDATLATQGNFNNEIGVPLTLLRLRSQHRVAVLELGMNHPGEIRRLADMAQPTVALVNNAQREHQEFMASVAAVARENGSVFQALPADGVAVFPAADAHEGIWRERAGGRRVLRFGTQSAGGDAWVEQADWRGNRWRVQARLQGQALAFQLHAPGRHNLSNALAALSCAHAAGAPLPALEQGLAAFRPVAGRMQSAVLQRHGRSITLIDDTYNANPDSVRALVDVLCELPGPRLLVLGDMGEVGAQAVAWHAEVGRYARQQGIDRLLALGPESIHTAMAFGGGHFDDMGTLIAAVRTNLEHCASVAVKGSRFMHMERVVQALQGGPEGRNGGERRAA